MVFPNNDSIELGKFLSGYMEELQKGFDSIDVSNLAKVVNVLDDAIKRKSTIFTCGNGGSAAISEHFVCDFLKGASTGTSIEPIMHSLTSNTPVLTALANDISYNDIFSFQLEKYGKNGDILLCISSSGNSPNIINAIQMAKTKNIVSIALVGFVGGNAKDLSDHSIHIPSKNYGIVEDFHHILMHMLAQYIRVKNMERKEDIEQTVF